MSRRRRGVLALLATLLLLVALGLLAWGPLPIGAHAHQYADARSWLQVPNATNVLVNLPIFWLGVWGWCATRVSAWPRSLRLPWQGFHLWVMTAALAAAMYHAAPSDALMVVTRTCQACAFVLLALGLLAERVDARFGSMAACVCAAIMTTATGLAIAYAGRQHGGMDLRPLLWLESIPILLIPTAVLRVAGTQTRASHWLIALAIYAVSRLFELADGPIFNATGWVSGHTLMHLGFAAVVGWMAYRAAATRTAGATADLSSGALSQRQTSLNTTA
jgi:hypothetical protein